MAVTITTRASNKQVYLNVFSAAEISVFFRSNFLQVEVYFDEIKYTEEIELPAYRMSLICVAHSLFGFVLSSNDPLILNPSVACRCKSDIN